MNANYKKVPTEFGAVTAFEVNPVPAVSFGSAQANHFAKLKRRLLEDRLLDFWEPKLAEQLNRAANEAAALAWVTPYPLLVFPWLFEEKAEAALQFAERQEEIRQRSRELLAV